VIENENPHKSLCKVHDYIDRLRSLDKIFGGVYLISDGTCTPNRHLGT